MMTCPRCGRSGCDCAFIEGLCVICDAADQGRGPETIPPDLLLELKLPVELSPPATITPTISQAMPLPKPDDITLIEGYDSKRTFDLRRKEICVYSPDGDRVPLHHLGRGRSAFLALSGPSLATLPLHLLQQRGVVTMAVNNAPAGLVQHGAPMPQLWTCVDTAKHFIEQIWKDPSVMKFAPTGHIGSKIKVRNSAGNLIDSAFRVEEMPNVFYYQRASLFRPQHYLTESDFCWGNGEERTDELGIKGGRSVMLVAIKMLYYLGFSTVYLIGADFKMEEGKQNYAFAQDRTASSVRGNNSTYRALNKRFQFLGPYFKAAGFEVLNATPDSGLTAFKSIDFELAVQQAARECNEKPINTLGHYELK